MEAQVLIKMLNQYDSLIKRIDFLGEYRPEIMMKHGEEFNLLFDKEQFLELATKYIFIYSVMNTENQTLIEFRAQQASDSRQKMLLKNMR